MLKVVPIEQQHTQMLEVFCEKCADLGYFNNDSIEQMKLDWCKDVGEYFCAIKNNEIVAVAGCHPFPQMKNYSNPWRILFRGCELPKKDTFKGLGKGDWNSITQREFIPLMIEYCNSDNLFITTNIETDNSNGKAKRNHKLMKLLAKQGILDHEADMPVYDTYQSIWKLNIAEYTRRRNKLGGTYV